MVWSTSGDDKVIYGEAVSVSNFFRSANCHTLQSQKSVWHWTMKTGTFISRGDSIMNCLAARISCRGVQRRLGGDFDEADGRESRFARGLGCLSCRSFFFEESCRLCAQKEKKMKHPSYREHCISNRTGSIGLSATEPGNNCLIRWIWRILSSGR